MKLLIKNKNQKQQEKLHCVTEYGNHVDVTSFQHAKKYEGAVRKVIVRRATEIESYTLEEWEKHWKIKSCNRSCKQAERIIFANFSNASCVFITLTFNQAMTELAEANTHLKKFIYRLKQVQNSLKYFSVHEYQKNGNLHFHLLAEMEFLPVTKIFAEKVISKGKLPRNYNTQLNIYSLWEQGDVTIRKVNNIVRIVRYLRKSFRAVREIESNSRLFSHSKNLIMPQKIWMNDREHQEYLAARELDDDALFHQKTVYSPVHEKIICCRYYSEVKPKTATPFLLPACRETKRLLCRKTA